MSGNRSRNFFVAGAAMLLVSVMAFSYMLNITAMKTNFSESVQATYNVTGKEAVRIIEYSLKYGKSLSSFFGMNDILSDIITKQETVAASYVFDKDGKLLYSQVRGDYDVNEASDAQRASLFQSNPGFENRSLDLEAGYHLLIPVLGKGESPEGGFGIVLDNGVLKKQMTDFMNSTRRVVAIITLLGLGLIAWLLNKEKSFDSGSGIDGKRILMLLIIVLMVTQGSYTGYNIFTLNNVYKEMALKDAAVVRDIITDNTDRLTNVGLALSDLVGIEKWMNSICESVPEVGNIIINDGAGETVYTSGSGDGAGSGGIYDVSESVSKSDASMGSVHVLVSQSYIRQKLMNAFLDSLSVLVASILVYIELSLLMVYALNRKMKGRPANGEEVLQDGTLIRSLAFLFLFGTDLSLSFIPIMSRQIVETGAMGLSQNVAMGLPIQAEMLTASIMALVTGIVMDKMGWKPPFIAGIAGVAIGSFLCSISGSLPLFIAARAFVGIGYGLSWTSLTGYVGSFSNEEARRQGLAGLVAGIYAGSNCGVVTGAMLAERMSYGSVFLVAIGFVAAAGIMGYVFVSNTHSAHAEEHSSFTVGRFLADSGVMRVLVLVTVPAMCVLMFLNYYVPLYSQEINLSQSNLGRLFLIYGLSIIYLGPYLTEKLGKKISAKQMLVSASLLVGGALLAFAATGTVWMLVLTIIIFSVADSYGTTANTTYFMELDATKKLGKGKAIGILSTVRKFGMMLGPYAFGMALIYPKSVVLLIIGSVYIVSVLLFAVLSRRPRAVHG